ncbi:HupE/UreJ family protein [Sphaerospermopsis aphanizomenoides BCCUSP55]|uniref:HupE/UreJ family protein n=1 Tax=Sphaerospermopsis aphanizomenoides TaxID=459663 RepID=UPI0019079903|nr:HupE/UreJ family protein [Sphaerospermopsis aphanizomenoides]MBK1989369.1 HupE/UreJ family protein [Sphaerospermopsis aphanizomenoides BCCUSP55]
MLKIAFSASDDTGKFSASKQLRLMGAIAALILISLLTSSGGEPIQHTISNSWEGFIWGIADPVIGLDRLAGILALGLLSTKLIRGTWISIFFVFSSLLGQILHLFQLNLQGAEIIVALCTIIFGVLLIIPTQISWLGCAFLSVTAGLSQGYTDSQAIMGTQILTLVPYLIGVTLTQIAIVMSARKIGSIITQNVINQILPKTLRWVGLTFCAIGIVFLGNAII